MASIDRVCPICGGDAAHVGEVAASSGRPARAFGVCDSCGAVRLAPPALPVKANVVKAARLGSKERYGRDLAMAAMACAIIGRDQLDVLWWEPGASADAARIEGLPSVAAVHRWEHGTAAPAVDVIVGQEVMQCQPDPAGALRDACLALREDGLVVLSTDLYDGSDPHGIGYLRSPAHRLMWSFEAVERVVGPLGLTVDCRLPEIAVSRGLARKRYLLLTRSETVRRRTRRFFGAVVSAPSEMPPKPSTRQEVKSAYETAALRGRRLLRDLWSRRPRRNDRVA